MKVQIIKGQFKGKTGDIIARSEGVMRRLAGGPTTTSSLTVMVEGMQYPVELSPSSVK